MSYPRSESPESNGNGNMDALRYTCMYILSYHFVKKEREIEKTEYINFGLPDLVFSSDGRSQKQCKVVVFFLTESHTSSAKKKNVPGCNPYHLCGGTKVT